MGNDILPFTEPNPGGGAAASTSIYAVSFGDGGVVGIHSAGSTQEISVSWRLNQFFVLGSNGMHLSHFLMDEV